MRIENNVVLGHFDNRPKIETVSGEIEQKLASLAKSLKGIGFDPEDKAQVSLKPWLVPRGYSPSGYSQNLSKVELEQDQNYGALVSPLCSNEQYIVVFSIYHDFELGEPWKLRMYFHCIYKRDDLTGNFNALFDEEGDHGSLTVVTSEGWDEFDMRLSTGLSIDFLNNELETIVRRTADYLALHVDEMITFTRH